MRPDSSKPAQLRTLPYPFTSFLTVTSDCDSYPPTEVRRWEHVGEIVREQFALPMSDSVFVDWLIRRGEENRFQSDVSSSEVPRFCRERFIEENGFMLRRFHRGWFDVAHGWIQRFLVRVAEGFCLQPSPDPAWAYRHRKGASGPLAIIPARLHRPPFVIAPEWEKLEAPRYLFFRYALPISGSHFLIRGFVDSKLVFEVGSGVFDPHYRLAALPAVVDLIPLLGNVEEILCNLEIEFELLGGGTEATLTVEDLMFVSDIRRDVRHHLDVMQGFNIGFSTFSSHAIGMVIGARAVTHRASADLRWLADHRENPHYFKDILEESGVEFFNTFNNTSQERLLTLEEVLKPTVYNDGSVSYDFNRFFHWVRDEKGEIDMTPFEVDGEVTNPSVGAHLGHHIEGALEQMDGSGTGALIYTHAAMRCLVLMDIERRQTDKEPDHYDAIGPETRQALSTLADRYFNLSGQISEEKRVWVAPTSVLLRQAQVQRQLREHAWYDPESETLYVETWFDGVTGLPVPHPSKGVSDLRWATFYVNDSQSCRLLVDDLEVSHLIRNPPDSTGRPSVTIADVACPTIIFDEVALSEKGEVTEQGVSCSMQDSGAFRGQWALRMTGEAEEGRLSYTPWAPIDLRNQQSLRLAFRRLSEDALFDMRIHRSDGVVWELGDRVADGGYRLLVGRDREWHDVVVPFWMFEDVSGDRQRRPPAAEIVRIEFRVLGSILIDCFELLRDHEAPPSQDDGCVVGGRVLGKSTGVRIVMAWSEREATTRPTPSGYYIFEERVPRGSVVRLSALDEDGLEFRPQKGFRYEVLSDCLECDFVFE